jgi:hypothetical protein
MWTKDVPTKEGWYWIGHETTQFGMEVVPARLSRDSFGWKVGVVASGDYSDVLRGHDYWWHELEVPPLP